MTFILFINIYQDFFLFYIIYFYYNLHIFLLEIIFLFISFLLFIYFQLYDRFGDPGYFVGYKGGNAMTVA